MLLNKFTKILAEKKLRITQVGLETGLSRTTLTALAKNSGAGVNYDTIDKLCIYLEVTPGDFFEFYPSEIQTASDFIEDEISGEFEVTVTVLFTEKNVSYTMQLTGIMDSRFSYVEDGIQFENDNPSNISGNLFLDPSHKENETVLKYLEDYPPGIIEELKNRIQFQIASDTVSEIKRTWTKGRVVLEYKK